METGAVSTLFDAICTHHKKKEEITLFVANLEFQILVGTIKSNTHDDPKNYFCVSRKLYEVILSN